MSDHHDHFEYPQKRTFAWWVWQFFFVLMYPALITFSLLFTAILWFFSTLSRALTWVFKKFSPKASISRKAS